MEKDEAYEREIKQKTEENVPGEARESRKGVACKKKKKKTAKIF